MIQGTPHQAVLTTVVNTLRTLDDWCKKHRLEISKDKMVLMPMFIRNRDTYKNHPKITSWGLNVVTKMKYLGIMLDCKLDWFPHTQYLDSPPPNATTCPFVDFAVLLPGHGRSVTDF